MKNLNLEIAMNLVKKSNKRNHVKNVNERLLEVLSEKGPKDRQEVVVEITYLRLEETIKDFDADKFTKQLNAGDTETIKIFMKTFTTIKNGVDTSLANGQTNSNFSYNAKYAAYEIIKHANKTIELIKK